MSIFDTILNKLFKKAKPDTAPPVTPPAVAPAAGATASEAPAVQVALSDVDVAEVLDQLVKESGQPLNWRVSIVDTMKALGIDSSLEHRKQLATELKYEGDMNDSAGLNIWLHKQVMKALAENGGKLPADLVGQA